MNPLLEPWTPPFDLLPFDKVRDEHWGPALDLALAEARSAVQAIAADPKAPTFQNTIAALELADRRLSWISEAFGLVANADSNPTREALDLEFAPKRSALKHEIASNGALFRRVDALWQAREDLDLDPEEARVLLLTHRRFVRAGARLKGNAAERMKDIQGRLAVLMAQFGQNVLADERGWMMPLSEADLEGLPDFVVTAARAAGKERGADGAVLTLSESLLVPFLQFSPRRDLRRRAFEARTARGANGGSTDNRAIAAEILRLREEQARLLGYPSFADWKLEAEMARTPQAVRDLLAAVWTPTRDAAQRDAEVLERMLREDGQVGPLEPWDWHFYSEKRRAREHDLDETELKPYFQLDRMIEAAFNCASRLFGLEFREIEAPRYHPDVRAWEVTRAGQHLAVFMGDYFARPSKRSGAWCSELRRQSRLGGDIRPQVINVCNFARSEAGSPALLSWQDARMLFHEFGHALHAMLSDVTYPSVAGFGVAWDFVELPSMLFELWLEVPSVLAEFAVHADTGQPMPSDLRERLLGARNYDKGYEMTSFLSSTAVDAALHEGPAPADPSRAEAEVLERVGLPHAIRPFSFVPHFQHVFATTEYAAGTYSYLWSEVMARDAFAAFEALGDFFDQELAGSLEANILAVGGSRDEGESYCVFRGRMPTVEPLLRGQGLLPDAA